MPESHFNFFIDDEKSSPNDEEERAIDKIKKSTSPKHKRYEEPTETSLSKVKSVKSKVGELIVPNDKNNEEVFLIFIKSYSIGQF